MDSFKKIKLLVLLLGCFSLEAKNFGDLGKTYPITEKDMIEEMKERLSMKKGHLKNEIKKSYERYLNNPKGIFLPNTKKAQERYIDLSFTLKKDIRDAAGRLIHKAGKTINPFDHYSLNKKLCFINGSIKNQVKWALSKCQLVDKIILTEGKALNLMKSFKRRVYFDQRGYLSKKFELQSVPALVAQKERRIYVKEIYLP